MKYPTMRRQHSITVSFYAIFSASIFLGEITGTQSFSSTGHRLVKVNAVSFNDESTVRALATSSVETDYSFIQTELRGAAMKLHTRAQSPKEGQVPDSPKPTQPYVTTHSDYLAFLVDSQEVYRAMEEVVQTHDALIPFRNTGMERCAALETDVCFLTQEYKLERPSVGKPGREYATHLRQIVSIPEFMCHFYNHYFAHTAGGRMIGKQMSALLLDKKTLEFYKWDRDLNEIKDDVKSKIEAMALTWSADEKKECVDATASAFEAGGAINSYLSGRQSSII